MDQYLPIITAVVVAIITVYGNIKLGQLKTSIDSKTVTVNASDALRDDLLLLVDKYELRVQSLLSTVDKCNTRNETLQKAVSDLQDAIVLLRIDNRNLQADLDKTKSELASFTRKVYYTPDIGDKK